MPNTEPDANQDVNNNALDSQFRMTAHCFESPGTNTRYFSQALLDLVTRCLTNMSDEILEDAIRSHEPGDPIRKVRDLSRLKQACFAMQKSIKTSLEHDTPFIYTHEQMNLLAQIVAVLQESPAAQQAIDAMVAHVAAPEIAEYFHEQTHIMQETHPAYRAIAEHMAQLHAAPTETEEPDMDRTAILNANKIRSPFAKTFEQQAFLSHVKDAIQAQEYAQMLAEDYPLRHGLTSMIFARKAHPAVRELLMNWSLVEGSVTLEAGPDEFKPPYANDDQRERSEAYAALREHFNLSRTLSQAKALLAGDDAITAGIDRLAKQNGIILACDTHQTCEIFRKIAQSHPDAPQISTGL